MKSRQPLVWYLQRMWIAVGKFLSGVSLSTWLRIGVGIALAAFVWSWHSRGATIDDLRTSLTNERTAHAVTRASVDTLKSEIARQNAEIEAQRVAQDQARRDLAAAVAASAGSVDIIGRLTASSREPHPGAACEPSAAVWSVWP